MSDTGMAQLCVACAKSHRSGTWYYREQHGERAWICGIQFLLLDQKAMNEWRVLLMG